VDQIRLSFVGDVLIHQRLATRARHDNGYSFSAQFNDISKEIAKSDLASANLESLTAGNELGITGYPKFNAPVELLADLREAGFSVLNIANNHMLDTGEQGLIRTIENIIDAGLSPIGAATHKDDPDQGVVISVNGVRIGLLAYTDASKLDTSLITTSHVNHFPGEYRPVRMIRRLSKIKRDIVRLRKRSDVVILQLHFGEEYLRYPSAFQRELVAGLCEAPVDAIIAHHPHVLQPTSWVENSRGREVLVMYSLGNFFTGQLGIHRQIGGIFSLKISLEAPQARRVSSPDLLLTYVDPQKSFQVRRLADAVAEYDTFPAHEGDDPLNTAALYDRVIRHARTYIPALKVR